MSLKILYLSCHEVLEYNELKLLTEIEHEINPGYSIDVFSLGGAFQNPNQSGGFMRSVIPKGRFYPDLYQLAIQCDKDDIHPKLLEWADVCLMMHNSAIQGQKEQQRWLVRNWQNFKDYNVKVIWRSIGQSVPLIEREIKKYKDQGMKIVRYSPLEEKIPDFAGADAIIRFYEDEELFSGWTGEKKQILVVGQSFKQRAEFLNFPLLERLTTGFSTKVAGTGNEDLGELWLGYRKYHELISEYRNARVFLYVGGTIPAQYTLSFIEAWMMGIPVVAIGKKLRKHHAFNWDNYEVPDLITNGVNGYVSDDVAELRNYISMLLENHELAKKVGEAGRKKAIELFGRKQKLQEWADMLRRFCF